MRLLGKRIKSETLAMDVTTRDTNVWKARHSEVFVQCPQAFANDTDVFWRLRGVRGPPRKAGSTVT